MPRQTVSFLFLLGSGKKNYMYILCVKNSFSKAVPGSDLRLHHIIVTVQQISKIVLLLDIVLLLEGETIE